MTQKDQNFRQASCDGTTPAAAEKPLESFQETLGIPILGGGPSLSPDGTQLCFAGVRRSDIETDKDFPPALYVMDSRGGEPIRLTEPGSGGYAPTWSPDGRKIAFTRYQMKTSDEKVANLFAMPVGGGEPQQISTTDDQVEGSSAEWSPDGQEIAFTAGTPIWKVGRNGGEPKEIRTGLLGTPGQIDWSHDAKRLVFGFDKGRGTEL